MVWDHSMTSFFLPFHLCMLYVITTLELYVHLIIRLVAKSQCEPINMHCRYRLFSNCFQVIISSHGPDFTDIHIES